MQPIGYWHGQDQQKTFDRQSFNAYIRDVRQPIHILYDSENRRVGLAFGGEVSTRTTTNQAAYACVASLPPLYPEWLGDRGFQETHGVRFNYVGGAMARGIASTDVVMALARNRMLGFFGAAGLPLGRLAQEIEKLRSALTPENLTWGANLIHTPNEPKREMDTVSLYLEKGVQRIEAAAFMNLTPAVVRFSATGLSQNGDGSIHRKNHVFAKISRPEVARPFLSPAPEAMLANLVNQGWLTSVEAALARRVPIAEDITVESDSGGHTDNRPLGPLFSVILELSHELARQYGYAQIPRIGAAGGLGTPQALAGAFGLGAAYVAIGSVHQSCVESGVSATAKKMLAQAGLADMAMTAAADMFEQGVKVQVLRRGTMMPQRGNYLYELYSRYNSIDEIPAKDRATLEKEIFRKPLAEVWAETERFFQEAEPSQLQRAVQEPKYKMALIFRWYVGKSSQWPIQGVAERQMDYQLWCGPAMGAFNTWTQGTFLEAPENRTIETVSLNLLEGAAILTRAHQLRTYGLPLPDEAFIYKPEPLSL